MTVSRPSNLRQQFLSGTLVRSGARSSGALAFNFFQPSQQNNPSNNNQTSSSNSSNDDYTVIVDGNGKSPTGNYLIKGRVGWLNTRDLRVVYQKSDLRQDASGNFVPKPVEDSPEEKYEADLKPGEKNMEHWSERSTCYTSINDGATLLGAVHAGKEPKIISKEGDLWQSGSKSRFVNDGDYKYFEANPNCDLSIFVENTDRGYRKTIEWLSSIMLNPKIPLDCNQIDSNEFKSLQFVTNRLPGTRQEQINGRIYDKVRNHTQNGQASLIKGQTIGVNQNEYRIYGVIPRDENSKCIYHGASGSPVLIGKDGFVGVLSAAELYYNMPDNYSPEEARYYNEMQKFFLKALRHSGFISKEDQASYKNFMQKYNIIHVTPLTKQVAASLLTQVSKEYEKFKKQQWQSNMANASGNLTPTLS
ncbi:MAG: hypothetical protein SFU25_03935 [Candidatus Caenarcaniphilales bacterium]|nr:hypothetical protein [Candidatus Caenarcaniphilales bacterium]